MAPLSLAIRGGLRTSAAHSWLSSPITLAAVSTMKQSLFAKRRYVDHTSADIIDLVICIASVIGALTIIIPYCFNRRSRKLRHSLILGLATSDMMSSLIITSTTVFLVNGGNLTEATRFCTFAGYVFSTAIFTQHLWNLSIASITYMILVHPLSPLVGKIERHLVWLWPLFWAVALIVNGGAWSYTGFKNSDGYCTFNSSIGGDFVNIFQFVPRAFVVCVILILYTKLFFFLRRINLFAAAANRSTQTGQNAASQDHTASQQRSRGNLSIAIPMQERKDGSRTDDDSPGKDGNVSFPMEKNSQDFTLYSPVSSLGRRTSALLAKVRRTDSSASRLTPSTLAEGDLASKRNGSASSQGQASSSCARGSLQDTMQIVEYRDAVGGKSTSDERLIPQRTTCHPDKISEVLSLEEQISPKTITIPLLQRPSTASAAMPSRLAVISRPTTAPGQSSESLVSSRDGAIEEDDHLFAPMAVRRDVRDFGMTSPPQEHLKHYSLSAAGVKMAKKVLAESKSPNTNPDNEDAPGAPEGVASTDTGSATQANSEAPPVTSSVTYEDLLGANWTWGMAINQAEGAKPKPTNTNTEAPRISADVGRSHRGSSGKRQSSAWFTSASRKPVSEGVSMTSSSNSSDGNGVETTGSTLNRQASVLLLLYPAAYVLLFSVSMVRFFVDIIPSPEERDPKRNGDALHSIARWLIFAQGAIDALVFQLIERQFRRRLKRRRRIAAGEQVDDTYVYKAYSWLRKSMQRSLRRGSSASTESTTEQRHSQKV
jgi:hypothetical protein